jgi:hypothetical protein
VTDANNCSTSLSVQIAATDHTPPQVILKNAVATLNAAGTATLTPAMFDNGSFDAECGIANLSVNPTTFDCEQIGTHTVVFTATDNNGNTATGTATVTITDNIAPTLICPQNQTAPACASTVTYSPPQISDNCLLNNSPVLTSGLPSGSTFPTGITQQVFSYTDEGGNNGTCSFGITVTGGMNVQASAVPASCSDACNGSATLNVTGGSNPVAINWSNGQSGPALSGLCSGNYTATLTDATGCTQVQTVQVVVGDTEVPVLTCHSNVIAGYCSPAVTFALPQVQDNCTVNAQQIELITGLPSGATFPAGNTTQTYRYTDAGGNAGQCSFTVTVHPAPTVSATSSNVTCANLCNGTAAISVTGGQAPFEILWSNGFTGLIAPNLCPGTYTATITDADGCQQTSTAPITQPPALNLTVNIVLNNTNSTGNGAILITANGGTPPYNYVWTLNGQPFATTEDLLNLFAGQYAVTVTDANGCTVVNDSFTVGGLVSAHEPDNDLNWALYPNPATSEVFLEINELNINNARLSIFDVAGRLLREQEISSGSVRPVQIDLAGLPDGLLMFRLAHEQGYQVKTLVKTR